MYQRGGTYYERHIESCRGIKPTKKSIISAIKLKEKPSRQTVKLERRINLLEEQVKFLMSKIDNIEVQLTKGRTSELIGGGYNILNIQNLIKSKVLPGDSISIDEIISIKELQKYPITLIEKAIIDLIDDEVFDASEGRSTQKIQRNIGRLIRR